MANLLQLPRAAKLHCTTGEQNLLALEVVGELDHPEVLSEGFNNFAFGVLKQVDPRFLADAKNLFIVQFKADTNDQALE